MKTAIIGGGASGLACAVELAKRDRKAEITVFEHNDRVGKKILATGNGRCNLTNIFSSDENYRNFSFAGYALNEFTPESNVAFFNSIGLYTKADRCGRVYPMSNQASGVLDSLRFAAENLGVDIITDFHVDKIRKRSERFFVGENGGYDFLVIAAGGKAAPSQGSDGSGYALLRSFGHKITELSPSLVQLEIKSRDFVKPLKGVRCEVDMSLSLDSKFVCRKHGELLFADYGLSGIVSMEISAFASPYLHAGGKNAEVTVDFVPAYDKQTLCLYLKEQCERFPKKSAADILSGFLPKKIGSAVLKRLGISLSASAESVSPKTAEKIGAELKSTVFSLSGTRDFSFAQVTSGGVETSEFNPKTMESELCENLFCAGEILDVDGDCGGFNLNWAWSSGRLAAKSIAEKSGVKC